MTLIKSRITLKPKTYLNQIDTTYIKKGTIEYYFDKMNKKLNETTLKLLCKDSDKATKGTIPYYFPKSSIGKTRGIDKAKSDIAGSEEFFRS